MLNRELEVTLNLAFKEARAKRHEFMTVEHLLLALLDNEAAASVLRACGANLDKLRHDLQEFIDSTTPLIPQHDEERETQPTLGFQRVLQRAVFVEPNPLVQQDLAAQYPLAQIINDDIFSVYQNPMPVDVVVCLGVLYHLHSPLYLLELMVRQSDPKTIILDNFAVPGIGHGGMIPEPTNSPGNRYSQHPMLSFSIAFPLEVFEQALLDLGYKLQVRHDLDMFEEILQKRSCWMGRWDKHDICH